MRVTIDGVGRVVIPKQVRERLDLRAGTALELDEFGDHVELRPADREIHLDRTSGRPILRAAADAPLLTAEETRSLVERSRR